MILYLDASALVKRYIREKDSDQVAAWISGAQMVITSIITRAEVAAAVGRSRRMGILSDTQLTQVLQAFRLEWMAYKRLPVNEATVERADLLAIEVGLRGYDAVHLASAILWQEALRLPVTLATFDVQLAQAAVHKGLLILPGS